MLPTSEKLSNSAEPVPALRPMSMRILPLAGAVNDSSIRVQSGYSFMTASCLSIVVMGAPSRTVIYATRRAVVFL